MLQSKLNTNLDSEAPSNRIKSAILYEGSITIFDSRLCGFDIGTCLEVTVSLSILIVINWSSGLVFLSVPMPFFFACLELLRRIS